MALDRLSDNPERIAELKHTGRERQLIYATMLTTGLRKKELASVRLRNLELDAEPAFLTLDAANEKNREGNSIPLRADVAADLREWLAERLAVRRDVVRHSATVSFTTGAARLQGNYSDDERDAVLSPDERLFNVPSSLLRVLDRDLKAAGIAKRDCWTFTAPLNHCQHSLQPGRHAANRRPCGQLAPTNSAIPGLPQCLPLTLATGGETVSFPVSPGKLGSFNSEQISESTIDENQRKKARILTEKDSGQKSGRHDLNMRPPAPKAGALPS